MIVDERFEVRRRMQIRLLGSVEASADERPVALGGSKQRAVLAMLGLEANRLVSADRLIEGLWGEQPPASAGKMVQNYVWRLRKLLADGGDAEIVTRGRGYELQIDRELIDALRFERLVGEATRDGVRRRRAPGAGAVPRRAARRHRRGAVRGRGDPAAGGIAPDRHRAGDRRGPGRGPPPGGRRRDRGVAGRAPAARASARAAAAGAVSQRTPGRGARGLPTGPRDARRADRDRAGTRAAAAAGGDPAPGPGADGRAACPRAARGTGARSGGDDGRPRARARRAACALAPRRRGRGGAGHARRRVRDGQDAGRGRARPRRPRRGRDRALRVRSGAG